MSRIRYYLDENLYKAVARGLRNYGIDVLTTPEAGHMGMDDPDLLAFALAEGRVFVTQDDDFLVLHHKGLPHAGIAYSKPQTRTVKQLIAGLKSLYDELSAEDMPIRIHYL